jgi:carbamoyltransferase
VLILGFNAYHGDVAAALLSDGKLVAALEEERFRRIKHVAGIPAHAMRECLRIAGAAASDVDVFAVARSRNAHLWRRIWFGLTHRPKPALAAQYVRTRRHQASLAEVLGRALHVEAADVARKLRHVEHHPAHLASAFYASGWADAACCAIDGFGDFVSLSMAEGRDTHLDVLDRVYFPHSLGILYLAVTQWLGFGKWGDEYKVMGLAPYGTAKYLEPLRRTIRLDPGGRFALDLKYFRHASGEVPMTWDDGEPTIGRVFSDRLVELLGPARARDAHVEACHRDVAASVQRVFEEVQRHILNGLHQRVSSPRLCLAGGCAMNSVANGKIRSSTPFRDVYIQPAAGDNGTALGAALDVWHRQLGRPRAFAMEHGYWGTEYDAVAIAKAIEESGAARDGRCRVTRPDAESALSAQVAKHVAAGHVVGWFQGRMEWGARALGNRSIVADPRRADMRDIINAKIKLRETFRPFAPSVLEEAVDEYFDGAVPDPFMVQVYPVRPDKRSAIPAVTHVDGSGRLQTVSRAANPRYWSLIRAFADLTGVPVLLNTSFNENEPIVEHPSQALDCFLRTEMDVLVMGRHVLTKPAAGDV